jgi:hypothetical protein
MSYTAIKKFRLSSEHGKSIVSIGDTLEVDDFYGQQLVRDGLAVSAKMKKEHENKMLQDFEDKGLPTTVETPEQRTQGFTGPTDKSESLDERTQGKERANKEGSDQDKEIAKEAEKAETPNRGPAKPPEPVKPADKHAPAPEPPWLAKQRVGSPGATATPAKEESRRGRDDDKDKDKDKERGRR